MTGPTWRVFLLGDRMRKGREKRETSLWRQGWRKKRKRGKEERVRQREKDRQTER